MTNDNISAGKSSILLLSIVSILLGCSYFMASDMYVPSLPNMSDALSTSSSMARMTIAVFLIALALSQLFYGPASDKFGRKRIIFIGASIYLIGSLICMFSWNIYVLIIGRVIQGAGTGALLSLSRVIVQDSVAKDKFIHIVGWLSLFFMLAPAGAPVLGGLIETYFNWRISFLVMFILVVITTLIVATRMPETLPPHRRNINALGPKHLLANYLEILKHTPFVIYTFCMIAGFSGIVAFYTVGPFILINKYGMSPQNFGFLSIAIIGCAFIARLYMSIISLKKFGPLKTLFQGLSLMVLASTILVITSILGLAHERILIICVMLYAMGSSIVGPTVVGVALSFFSHKAGAANAVYGFLQMFGLFIVSSVAAIIPAEISAYALIIFVMSFAALTFLSILTFRQHTSSLHKTACA
ncbi:multidrug effflux MFS transporter [Cysteiniphilum sp. 6C5]|uniref:multidrug effflux MFS transporter n=1 Tax=unclassified Cysteiniphilum TaxID=2610889 RepID=UPI003F82CFB9